MCLYIIWLQCVGDISLAATKSVALFSVAILGIRFNCWCCSTRWRFIYTNTLCIPTLLYEYICMYVRTYVWRVCTARCNIVASLLNVWVLEYFYRNWWMMHYCIRSAASLDLYLNWISIWISLLHVFACIIIFFFFFFFENVWDVNKQTMDEVGEMLQKIETGIIWCASDLWCDSNDYA